MPSRMVRIYIALAGALACGILLPVYAEWGDRFMRRVLPSLVKRAAVSLIQQELYDLESHQSHQSHQSQQNYQPDPSNNYSIPIYQYSPEPPPYAPATPGRALPRTAPRTKSPTGYQWTPRPAIEYLPDGNELQMRVIQPDRSASRAFSHGEAGAYSYAQLVAAKVFVSYPLHGSIFKREGRVKYIILHSTETGSPADARRVIQSWNNRGQRHPGAQFVVDRDGTICSTTNPDLATVHVNTSKTLPGYTNDNSIGIEIVRSGKQRYTRSQLDSVMYLVSYLQTHYSVSDSSVTTHGRVQPSDRSDPVGFDLAAFQSAKSIFRNTAAAQFNPGDALTAHHAPERVVAPRFLRPSTLSTMPKPAPDFRYLKRNTPVFPLPNY